MINYLKCECCKKEEGEEEVELGGRKYWFCELCFIGSIPNSSDPELNKKIIKDNELWIKNLK